MSDYISRDAALMYLNDIWLTATPTDSMPDDERELAMVRCKGLDDAMDAVKSIPAADVRPVVTCGECKYRHNIWWQGCQGRGADWFCADGERRKHERNMH